MHNLETLLYEYEVAIYKDAEVEVSGIKIYDPWPLLMALEEMLGINSGGYYFAEALEQWLSLPPQLRKPVHFSDIKQKWSEEEQEVQDMVDRDLEKWRRTETLG